MKFIVDAKPGKMCTSLLSLGEISDKQKTQQKKIILSETSKLYNDLLVPIQELYPTVTSH